MIREWPATTSSLTGSKPCITAKTCLASEVLAKGTAVSRRHASPPPSARQRRPSSSRSADPASGRRPSCPRDLPFEAGVLDWTNKLDRQCHRGADPQTVKRPSICFLRHNSEQSVQSIMGATERRHDGGSGLSDVSRAAGRASSVRRFPVIRGDMPAAGLRCKTVPAPCATEVCRSGARRGASAHGIAPGATRSPEASRSGCSQPRRQAATKRARITSGMVTVSARHMATSRAASSGGK